MTLLILFLSLYIFLFIITIILDLVKAPENSNLELTLSLVIYALMVPILFLCFRYIHHRPVISFITTRQKFDFKRFLFGGGIWFVLCMAWTGVSLLLHPEERLLLNPHLNLRPFILMLLLGFTLLPLQTSFEEFLFRGLGLDGFNRLFGISWLSILLTSLLFASVHLGNPEVREWGYLVMIPQYFIMGLLLATTATLDKGLEMPMGIHFANNLYCMSFVVTENSVLLNDSSLFVVRNTVTDHTDTLCALLLSVLFIILYIWKFKPTFKLSNKEEKI